MCEASRTFPRFLREKSHRRNENKNWIAFQPNRCCNDCCWSIEFGLSSNRVKCIQKLIDSVGVLFSIRFPSIFLRTYFKIRETKSLAFGLGYKTATFPWKWNKFRDRNEFIACSEYCWPLKILQSNKRRLHLSHNKIVYLAAHIWFITTGRCCMEKMENIVFVSVYTRFVFLLFFFRPFIGGWCFPRCQHRRQLRWPRHTLIRSISTQNENLFFAHTVNEIAQNEWMMNQSFCQWHSVSDADSTCFWNISRKSNRIRFYLI